MKKAFLIIILSSIIFMFLSCSASWHIKRAIEKDPTILKEKIDTVKLFSKNIYGNLADIDCVYINDEYINISSWINNDSIKLNYHIKQQVLDTVLRTNLVYLYDTAVIKRTRQLIKYEARQKRLESRLEGRNNRLEIRKKTRVDIKKINQSGMPSNSRFGGLKKLLNNIYIFFIGFVIGFIFKYLKQKISKIWV